jgi:hypothetical protein
MAQLIIRVDGAFSGPQVVADPRLNDGSIVLIEPGHPIAPLESASNGETIVNLAATSAAALFPSAVVDTLTITNSVSPTTGLVEITPKGGLHVAVKQAGTIALERVLISWDASLQAALDAVMTARDTRMYFSIWGRSTRRHIYAGTLSTAGLLAQNTHAIYLGGGQASTGNITVTPIAATEGRATATLTDGLGLFRVDGGDIYSLVTDPTLTASFVRLGNSVSGGYTNSYGSMILYAAYLENLDASGRTYAEASALDQQMYDAAFGVGGRYYGDSWTDPLTL